MKGEGGQDFWNEELVIEFNYAPGRLYASSWTLILTQT